MRKIKRIAIMLGICTMAVVGCSEKEQVVTTDKTIEGAKDKETKTNAEAQKPDNVSESKEGMEDRWTVLWPGKSMEINLNAKSELIGGFARDGHDMYKAMRYSGESVTEDAYCYFFCKYFAKDMDIFADMSYPEDLEDVAEEIWEKGMSSWKGGLGEQNGAFLDRSTLTIDIQSKELVELDGRKFFREEVIGKSASMGVPKSSRFVVYYFRNEGGQGFCVFGDRSEDQTDANYENIKEVAEAIMSTFRE